MAVMGSRDAGEGLVVRPFTLRHRFSGVEGMRTLPNEGRMESFDRASFQADMTSIRLGTVTLQCTTISPHRAIVDGREHGQTENVLRLLVVKQGTVFAAAPGGDPARFDAGDALFVGPSNAYVCQTNDTLEYVTTTVPVSRLAASVHGLGNLPNGPLPHSPIVDAVVRLLFRLTDRLDEEWAFDAHHAAQGIIDLQSAILSELIGPRAGVAGPERVYSEAVDYIEQHLAEVELGPALIATALGVSVRYLHRAFADKNVTVGRYLRERRLEQIATTLVISPSRPSFDRLALRFGFSSQQQLARSFRHHYGVSMTVYASSRSTRQSNG